MSGTDHPTTTTPIPAGHTHVGGPVSLLEVTAERGTRTRADGPLWGGVLDATPDDSTDGPLPIESLLAALAGCLVRNMTAEADCASIALDRIVLRVAAGRTDDPPLVASLAVEADVTSDASAEVVARVMDLALRHGTIIRTPAAACPLGVTLSVNGTTRTIDVPAILGSGHAKEDR
jgi:uncharacterized OsmC-like protein